MQINGIHIKIKNFELNFFEGKNKLPTSFIKIVLNSKQTKNPTINNDRTKIKLLL